MKVKDAMTKNVVFVRPENSLEDLLTTLAKNHISGVPVVEDKKVVGIISESDVLEVLELEHLFSLQKHEDLKKLREMISKKGLKVKALMRKKTFTVRDDAEVEEAAKIIDQKNVNRLPVVDKRACIVGIVTRGDIIRVFARSLGKHLLADRKIIVQEIK